MYEYPNSSRYSRRDFDAVAEAYAATVAAGLPNAVEAAAEAGVGYRTAVRFLKRNGLLRAPRVWEHGRAGNRRRCRSRQERARRLARLRVPVPDIAVALGVSVRSAYRYVSEARA